MINRRGVLEWLTVAFVAVPCLALFWPSLLTEELGGWRYGRRPWLVWVGLPLQVVWLSALCVAVILGILPRTCP